ncbi:hypothetical protein Dsin_027185 [Dipteronia sinensis]|uniref:Uncharacterized protein n=1 Tax=Dipteronia sinensis TaxID=43782 RepID=A0AAD9ZZ06_9ROSI|nr:hypothetical protein Dsin_027185 [Dipteronia sinensis]
MDTKYNCLLHFLLSNLGFWIIIVQILFCEIYRVDNINFLSFECFQNKILFGGTDLSGISLETETEPWNIIYRPVLEIRMHSCKVETQMINSGRKELSDNILAKQLPVYYFD